MKAKDYAAVYLKDRSDKALIDIANDMFSEVKNLLEIRNVSTNEGLLSIINQQNLKWHAFARLVGPVIRKDGFIDLVIREVPEIKDYFPIVFTSDGNHYRRYSPGESYGHRNVKTANADSVRSDTRQRRHKPSGR